VETDITLPMSSPSETPDVRAELARLDVKIDAALAAGDESRAHQAAANAAYLIGRYGAPSGRSLQLSINHAVNAGRKRFAREVRTLDATDRDYHAVLEQIAELKSELEALKAHRHLVHHRAVIDEDLYAQYELPDLDYRIGELEDRLVRKRHELDLLDAQYVNQVEELEGLEYLSMRSRVVRMVVSRPRRPSCGRAPRVATNTRRRGSRRTTRGSPSSDDPDPPPESDIAAHRRPTERRAAR
jgi:hypothetical protein